MVKSVGSINKFSGTLLCSDKIEPINFVGTITVVFRANPGKVYTANASITRNSPRTLRLHWEGVSVGNTSITIAGSYILTKQE